VKGLLWIHIRGCTGLTLCIVDLYLPLVHLSSMSPRLTTMVPGSDGTSIQASLHLQPQHIHGNPTIR